MTAGMHTPFARFGWGAGEDGRGFALAGLLASPVGLLVSPLWNPLPALASSLHLGMDRRALAGLGRGAAPSRLLHLTNSQAAFGLASRAGHLTLRSPRAFRLIWPGKRILCNLTLRPAGGLIFHHPVFILPSVGFLVAWKGKPLRRDFGYAGGILMLVSLVLLTGAAALLAQTRFSGNATRISKGP